MWIECEFHLIQYNILHIFSIERKKRCHVTIYFINKNRIFCSVKAFKIIEITEKILEQL